MSFSEWIISLKGGQTVAQLLRTTLIIVDLPQYIMFCAFCCCIVVLCPR